jgi:hypothetical protein
MCFFKEEAKSEIQPQKRSVEKISANNAGFQMQ